MSSSYIDHSTRYGLPGGGYIQVPGHSWRQHTYLNLAQQYGPWRAALIVDGKDPATQADIARWNALGRRSAA